MDPYQSNDELCNALLNRSSNQLGNRFWRDKKVSPQKKILFSIFLVVVSIPFLFVTINHYHETKERLFAKNGIHKTNDLQLQKTSSGTVRFGGDNDHSGPTVLSVIDESTNQFISVTNNPIYKLLQSSRFIGSGTSNSQSSIHVSDVYGVFQLFLDKEEMYSFHEPLEVTWSWSPEADNNSLTEGSKINGGVYEDDVLALYCQPLSLKNLSEEVNFFDFSKPRDAASIAQTRSSSRFHYPNQMLNNNTWYIPSFPTIREETCHFRLLRRMGTFRSNPGLLLLAVSNNLHLPSKNTATGVHLSLTNNPEEMVVQFTTGANGIPLVEVTHHDGTIFVYQGNSTTYTNKDMCQAPANSTEIGCFIPPGNLHTVLIENLVPSTKYLYRVGLKSETDQEGEYNEDYYSFITIPTIGSNDPFAFIAYGDQGCPVDGWALGGNMSAIMVERELDNAIIPIRAVHHFGDLSYARGHAHLWDDWLDMISIFSSRVPLLVGVRFCDLLL
jgi:autotransporter-associated beta strand protein